MKEEIKQTTRSIKIFIDSDDEIVDLIDKLTLADSNQLLLILPKHSLIGSSTVNLKLLSRKLVSLKKAAILITPSELITNKAHEAFLISKTKVEEVNQETWKDAFMYLEELKTFLKEKKDKLINERKETNPIHDEKSSPVFKEVEEVKENLITEPIISERTVKTSEPELYPNITPINIPISKPKIINVGNFVFLPGGDIKEHLDTQTPITKPIESKQEIETSKKKDLVDLPDSILKPDPKFPTPSRHISKTSLVGQDISSYNSNNLKNFEKRRQGNKNIFKKLFPKKLIILLILIFPSLYFYRSYAENLNITIRVESKSIELSEQVKGSIDIKDVDITTKRIPIKKIIISKSMSDTSPTTGEGLKGEKATGVMDFFNKTPNEVILPAGTALTTINGNLTFYLNAQAKIPAAISDITPSKLESVPIIASEPGEQYNITGTDVKINGFDPNSQLSGRIFRDVKGGTSEKIKVVSQQDVDSLKKSLTETIRKLLDQELEKSLTSDDIKIPNSNTVLGKKFEITPKVGEEGDEFSIIALEYEMTQLTISQRDLDKLANSMIKEKYNMTENDEIDSNQAATFENLQILENGEIQFTIRKQGKIKADINESIIKASIENQQIENIGSKLSEIKEIKDYEVKYKPEFLPKFLQRVPADKSKIFIKIESVN